MLDPDRIMSLAFLDYGGEMTGDHYGMRYMMKKEGEKPDFVIKAYVWPEPFCFDKTDKGLMFEKEFEFSKEGRLEAISWFEEMYNNKKDIWNTSGC